MSATTEIRYYECSFFNRRCKIERLHNCIEIKNEEYGNSRVPSAFLALQKSRNSVFGLFAVK